MDTSNDIQNTIISDSTNHADLEWAIGMNRFGINIVGLWPEMEENQNRKLLSNLRLYITFVLMLFFLVIPQMCSLVRVWGNFLLVLDNLQFNLPMLSTTLKCCILWWKKEALSPAVRALTNDWLKMKSTVERDTMIRQARLSRAITLAGYFMIIIIWCMLIALPCFGLTMRYVSNFTDPGGKPLPIQSYFFYDITKRSNFLITYILQGISYIFAGIYFTGVDCFFALLILHVCGQLENLKIHLTSLGDFQTFRKEFSFCVDEHVRLIRLINIVDNAVNLMLLLQLLIFVVLFCFQGFFIIEVFKEGSDLSILRLIWLIGAIVAILAHMFLYCFVGEILAARCEEIYEAAYNNEWYTLEANKAKMLTLILIRARSPLYITAGKMFPMTLATFCSVIKTSVSYVSVLLAYS